MCDKPKQRVGHKSYGIDLGTTNTIMYEYDGTTVRPTMDLTPSAVDLVNKKYGKGVLEDKRNLVSSGYTSYKVDMQDTGIGMIPIMLSAYLLEAITKDIRPTSITISVPAYFNSSQRKAVLRAARDAKLKDITLINEPTAAAIAYQTLYDKSDLIDDRYVLVFDLGGGTFDVSLVDLYKYVDVVATKGKRVGGINLDGRILEDIYGKLQIKRYNLPGTGVEEYLSILAEDIKLEMQKKGKTIKIDLYDYREYFNTMEYVYKLTPDEYIAMMEGVFKYTVLSAKDILNAMHLTLDDVEILLVGGSTRDPYLQKLIQEYLKKPLPQNYNPDLIVAEGAAIYSYYVDQGEASSQLSDVAKGIGIALSNKVIKHLIPSGTKIPYEDTAIITNATCGTQIILPLHQTDNSIATESSKIYDAVIQLDKEYEKGAAIVLVTLAIDINGELTLTTEQPLTGTNRVVLYNENI